MLKRRLGRSPTLEKVRMGSHSRTSRFGTKVGMNLSKLTQLKSGRSLMNAIAIAVFALFMFRRITGEG